MLTKWEFHSAWRVITLHSMPHHICSPCKIFFLWLRHCGSRYDVYQRVAGFRKTLVFKKAQPTGFWGFIGFWALLGFSDFFI